MRPARSAITDVAAAGGVHLIPLALVLAGQLETIDVLLVYVVETIVGLGIVTVRLVRRATFAQTTRARVKRRMRVPKALSWMTSGAQIAALVAVYVLCYLTFWGLAVARVIQAADWDGGRLLFAALTGAGLAGYTWYAFRRDGTPGLGLGRLAWQMFVLMIGVFLGLAATDHYITLVDHGWEPSQIGDVPGHALATQIARVMQFTGVHPEAFAAVMVASLMAFNEAAITALRHINTPAADLDPGDVPDGYFDIRRD